MKILIPTDYSETAKKATDIGMQLAQKMGAEVLLFHSFSYPLMSSEDLSQTEQLAKQEQEDIEKEATLWKSIHQDLKVETFSAYGSAVDHISAIVEEKGVDLIVMGTKGESNAMDTVFGSVCSHVINNVKCPTIVIPEKCYQLSLNEIVLASDFHKIEKLDTFDLFFEIAAKFDAHIALLNVQHALNVHHGPNETEQWLDGLLEKYKHSHHFIESDNKEEAILDFAREGEYGMICISTKHYSFWQKLFHTSMARALALHSEVPLFILHED